jgi:hypothetical protein
MAKQMGRPREWGEDMQARFPAGRFKRIAVISDPPPNQQPPLVMLVRFHGLGADPEQIRHCFAGSAIGIPEIVRCARELGPKAQTRPTTWKRVASTPLPAIAALHDGGFLLIGKIGDDKALVQSPLSPQQLPRGPVLWRQARYRGQSLGGGACCIQYVGRRVSAPVLPLAQIWQDFHRARLTVADGRYSQHLRRADLQSRTGGPSSDPRRHHLRACHLSLPRRWAGSAARRQFQRTGRPSGSGKSTLAKLAQRLYVPENGRVLIEQVIAAARSGATNKCLARSNKSHTVRGCYREAQRAVLAVPRKSKKTILRCSIGNFGQHETRTQARPRRYHPGFKPCRTRGGRPV